MAKRLHSAKGGPLQSRTKMHQLYCSVFANVNQRLAEILEANPEASLVKFDGSSLQIYRFHRLQFMHLQRSLGTNKPTKDHQRLFALRACRLVHDRFHDSRVSRNELANKIEYRRKSLLTSCPAYQDRTELIAFLAPNHKWSFDRIDFPRVGEQRGICLQVSHVVSSWIFKCF